MTEVTEISTLFTNVSCLACKNLKRSVLYLKCMNTVHKYHNNKIKPFLLNTCEFASGLEQAGCRFIFFKGAAVSLPNVAHTFDMTNEHRTAKLMTPSPSCQLAGEVGGWGAVTASATREQRVGTLGSVHPYVIKRKEKKKNHLTHRRSLAQRTNADVTPAANKNKRFVQT